jgi:hypothetical protein
MIAGQAEARNVPARDVAKFKGAAGSHDLRQRRAARVGGTEDAADTGAGNVRNGDVIFFKNLEHAKMREAASKSSTKRKGYTWPRRVVGEQRVVLKRCVTAEHGANKAMVLNIFMYWLRYWLSH